MFSVGTKWRSARFGRKVLVFVLSIAFFELFLLLRTGVDGTDGRLADESNRRSTQQITSFVFGLFDVMPWAQPFSQFSVVGTDSRLPVERWYLPLENKEKSYYTAEHFARYDLHSLWPQQNFQSDRIENQLLYQPKPSPEQDGLSSPAGINHSITAENNATERHKIIFVTGSLSEWYVERGQGSFLKDKCPVNTCSVTNDAAQFATADAVVRAGGGQRTTYRPNQIWILYMLESPLHTPSLAGSGDVYNWTATYRLDSDIVAPYEKFVLYDPAVLQKKQPVDYAKTKSGKAKVAWFVSNCGAKNNRLEYAEELSKYITVDIYGGCGSKQCGRHQTNCIDMLKTDYKFYLAFENSNCRWYITEKFWVNALGSSVLPIVMGAPLKDYELVAPYKSFIHVDQFPEGPEALARYLHQLDRDDTLYNEYFQWKGTGQLINTFFLCRLCAMLHADYPKKSYDRIEDWWRGPNVCSEKQWTKS